MPPYKQGGAFQRWAAVSHRLRSPFCSDNGELPLPKPLRSAILTRNRRISGECLFRGPLQFTLHGNQCVAPTPNPVVVEIAPTCQCVCH